MATFESVKEVRKVFTGRVNTGQTLQVCLSKQVHPESRPQDANRSLFIWCIWFSPNMALHIKAKHLDFGLICPKDSDTKTFKFLSVQFHKRLHPEQPFLVKFSKLFSPTNDLQQLGPVHFIYIRQIHNECHLLDTFQENMSKKPKFFQFIMKVNYNH